MRTSRRKNIGGAARLALHTPEGTKQRKAKGTTPKLPGHAEGNLRGGLQHSAPGQRRFKPFLAPAGSALDWAAPNALYDGPNWITIFKETFLEITVAILPDPSQIEGEKVVKIKRLQKRNPQGDANCAPCGNKQRNWATNITHLKIVPQGTRQGALLSPAKLFFFLRSTGLH